MDISARATSLADRPRRGHLGHQGSHAPGRPILHLYLSSLRPRLDCNFLPVVSSFCAKATKAQGGISKHDEMLQKNHTPENCAELEH